MSSGFIVDEVSILNVRLLSPRRDVARHDTALGIARARHVLFGKQSKFPGDESDIAEVVLVTGRLLHYSGIRVDGQSDGAKGEDFSESVIEQFSFAI